MQLSFLADLGATPAALYCTLLATSREVAGWRPDEVNDFFCLSNPFGRTKPWGLLSL
jgi:hypothetical protein